MKEFHNLFSFFCSLSLLHSINLFGIANAVELIDEGVDLGFEVSDLLLGCFGRPFGRLRDLSFVAVHQFLFQANNFIGEGGELLQEFRVV